MFGNKYLVVTVCSLVATLWNGFAQTNWLEDPFTDLRDWTAGPRGSFSNPNDQFVITASFAPANTNSPIDTHAAAFRPISASPFSGPLPDNQTLELRADLVQASQDEAFASVHFLWSPENQGYLFMKNRDEVALIKFYDGARALAYFFWETIPLKNTQVTLVLSLTRSGSEVRVRTRVLDRDNFNAVLFERTVIDTAQADPVLPNRSIRGFRCEPDLSGTPWPVLRVPDRVELDFTWANPDRAAQPAVEVTFDNLEVWHYESPQLKIQNAVVLSWPAAQGTFALESAPSPNGPWEQAITPWTRTHEGQIQACIAAPESMRLFRLRQASFPGYLAFDRAQGEVPEGVAVDRNGNVFVSVGGPGGPRRGEIWKFTPAGTKSVLIDFGTPGVTGLTVDDVGNVYVARGVAPNQGVYRVDPAGQAVRLPGTEQIVMPNSLAFDGEGNLFVTETFSFDPPLVPYPSGGIAPAFGRGGVWRIPPQGNAELWLRDDQLTGTGLLAGLLQFPAGANGIGHYQGALYIANTERGLILRIPILPGGGPGNLEVVAQVPDPDPAFLPLFGPPVPDGLALDNLGNIYVTVINRHAVVRITPDGTRWETVGTAANRLDAPASLAFGTTPGERTSLFVTSMSMVPGFAGPSLVKIETGIPGLPLP